MDDVWATTLRTCSDGAKEGFMCARQYATASDTATFAHFDKYSGIECINRTRTPIPPGIPYHFSIGRTRPVDLTSLNQPHFNYLSPPIMESSCLNGLPAELRNLIYEYVLYEPQGANISITPGLLQTCSLIRREAQLMFYAINRFTIKVHEELMNHDLCEWLRCKAGQRLNLIRGLDINVQMPSISDRHAADNAISRHSNSEEEEDSDSTSALSFLQLMHTVESIRSTVFKSRPIESVVNWTLNGASDSETFESIGRMPVADQDSHRGAKFLVLCMVHGQRKTLGALHADDPVEELTILDSIIQRRRAGIVDGPE